LATTKQQLAALNKAEVKDLIALQRQLASERAIRAQILEKLSDAKKGIGDDSVKTAIESIGHLAEVSQLKVGAQEFKAISEGAADFEKSLNTAQTQVQSGLTAFEALVSHQIAGWKSKDAEGQKQVDAKRRELEALNVSFDMSYIAKLAKDEASHQQAVNNLKSWVPHLKGLNAHFGTALKARWAARDRIATLREAFGRPASTTLKEALSDLQVTLKYSRNAYSPEAANQIIQTMCWRTNQQTRANWLVGGLTVPLLLDAIKKEDVAPILNIKTPEGVEVFKRDEAEAIVASLGQPEVRFALERAQLHDLPRLLVSRKIEDEHGNVRYLVREFSKLSLGQQQSVLLALMLSSNSDRPLIIDQPEDNLDGEFIYFTLVQCFVEQKSGDR
jgi:hypothetical protein